MPVAVSDVRMSNYRAAPCKASGHVVCCKLNGGALGRPNNRCLSDKADVPELGTALADSLGVSRHVGVRVEAPVGHGRSGLPYAQMAGFRIVIKEMNERVVRTNTRGGSVLANAALSVLVPTIQADRS